MSSRLTAYFLAAGLMAGCAEEVPTPTVQDYLDDPIMLEAAVVRCAQNRSESRYEAECVKARQAASIIAAKEERERREVFEAESERKRQALRRTQHAAAEARRRADEAERQRREAEYLAQFGELPPAESDGEVQDPGVGNAPGAVIAGPQDTVEAPAYESAPIEVDPLEARPAEDDASAPLDEPQTTPPADLDAIREELRKRGEESGG